MLTEMQTNLIVCKNNTYAFKLMLAMYITLGLNQTWNYNLWPRNNEWNNGKIFSKCYKTIIKWYFQWYICIFLTDIIDKLYIGSRNPPDEPHLKSQSSPWTPAKHILPSVSMETLMFPLTSGFPANVFMAHLMLWWELEGMCSTQAWTLELRENRMKWPFFLSFFLFGLKKTLHLHQHHSGATSAMSSITLMWLVTVNLSSSSVADSSV